MKAREVNTPKARKIMVRSNPLVSVIILNYNGKRVLEQCLDSVFASSYTPFEVIVVDNCSTDGSAEAARSKWNFKLIKNKKNVGYCAGNNIGIRNANGEFVVLLNNDTVVHPQWLKELLTTATRSKADFCQPKIIMLDDPKIINSAGNVLHMAGFGLMRGAGEVDKGQYDAQEKISSLHGACIFVSKDAIADVGLLDENFFSWNEDTDWAWRALLRGFKLVYVSRALVKHKYGEAWGFGTPKKFYYAERNRIIMLLTNYSHRSVILLSPLFILTEIATLGYCLFNRTLRAKIVAYADLIRMRHYIVERRKRIQARRRVSDGMIVRIFTSKFEHPFFGKYIVPLNALYGLMEKLIVPFV